MRFRVGFVTGMAVGYVLGAQAGRERYEQIRAAAVTAWRSDQAVKARRAANQAFQQASEQVRTLVGPGGSFDEAEFDVDREIRLP